MCAAALAAAMALLAGCGAGAPSATTPAAVAGVYVTNITQWSSEHPGVTYITVSALAPDSGKIRWQHREEWDPYHGGYGGAVIVGDVLYMVGDANTTSTDPAHSLSGFLIALRASDGGQLWRTEVGALASRPIVDGATIYVSAEKLAGKDGFAKEVYVLNAGNGSVRWKTEIPNTRTISDYLVLSQGRLIIGASQLCFDSCSAAYLIALDADTGRIAWQQSWEGNFTLQPPVVEGAAIYVYIPGYGEVNGQPRGGFLALSVADGHQLWRSLDLDGSYVVSGGMVYTEKAISPPNPSRPDLQQYGVIALDGATGTQRWQTPADIYPAVLAVQDGAVIVKAELPNPRASQTNSPYLDVISALRTTDGKLLWRAPQNAYETWAAATAAAIYLSLPSAHIGGQAYMAALDTTTGNILWRQPVGPANVVTGEPGFGVTAPDANGGLFCVFSSGVASSGPLYGVRTSDGHTLWSANLSASGAFDGVTIIP
jgi:outer membrane protein assembly factor BamB